ncbi:metal ABC transporter permease [Gracilinema caldarium]|uniref:ABC-type transporter, integral membrane subunit n=1 Tax=Gracilinema caldarium (strain ATCC 51460 / DSM 7334 / H1) TaxID=744872 RepID=F8F0Z1_GRAC1|nr:iron chelate uptake ABC transporter family permease subunit [Gracilinema caldarium]AEJ20277.1 ABC-type transporter, integral membrane subunit [Gracilinema caldarium DSM 7334]
MNSFFSALFNPAFPFLQNALMASLLASILFGILGSVVTVKRIAGLAGAISHAVLGGIGMALFFSSSGIVPFITPMAGAILFAVLSALIIGMVSVKAKQREDTVINAIWAIGMSLGVLFLAKTPGYRDPTSYLFGNILLVSREDLMLLAILDTVVLILVWRFYPQLEASAFDEEFARVRGVPTNMLFFIILGITAIAVVLLQTFVGIVMVIAMLTLPAGTAGYLAKNLAGMMILSWIFSSIFSFFGLALSWHYDLPSGAVVVVLSGAVFLMGTGLRLIIVRYAKKRGLSS